MIRSTTVATLLAALGVPAMLSVLAVPAMGVLAVPALGVLAVPALGVLAVPALGDTVIAPDRPYIFTPSHAGKAQYVRFGAPVQIQLPGGPTTWQIDQLVNAQQTGARVYPSPDRVVGTSTILAFDFEMLERDKAVITLFSSNVPEKYRAAIPTGRYRITLVPID